MVATVTPALTGITARSYRIPTSTSEADGTFSWNSTTLVVVHVGSSIGEGIGYTYASQAVEKVIKDSLWPVIQTLNPFDIPACWMAMRRAVRNSGQSGIAACAISAIDTALWDIKAKALNTPLWALLGRTRERIDIYGSGGFTTYSPAEIRTQINHWKHHGINDFKIKIGLADLTNHDRIEAALNDLPRGGHLMVDANGAYTVKQALRMAEHLDHYHVTWFEEPISSDDIEGLRLLRQRAPSGMDIAAGEYAYVPDDAHRLLESGAIDVLQIDATRCEGVTGFLGMAMQAEAHHRPISSHCAPTLHVPLCCHAVNAVHIEYFWDHERIEQKYFDGAPQPKDGKLRPSDAPGLGIALKKGDVEEYAL